MEPVKLTVKRHDEIIQLISETLKDKTTHSEKSGIVRFEPMGKKKSNLERTIACPGLSLCDQNILRYVIKK